MRTSGEHLWIIINEPQVCWHRIFRWDKLQLSSAIKDLPSECGNVLGRQRNEPPPAPHVSWQSIFCSELAPCAVTLGLPAVALLCFHLSLPFHPLIWVPALWEERGEGSEGQSLFLFGSWGLLGEAWLENDCIRAGVGGVKILILLKNSWFEFLRTSLFPPLSPQIQGDEKFVQRGTSKIKKVYGPKPLPLLCSSIREECNNVSIWPQLDGLITRKSFLCLGVLTTGWNLIKKLKNWEWIFHTWNQRNSLPRASITTRSYYFSDNAKQVSLSFLAAVV